MEWFLIPPSLSPSIGVPLFGVVFPVVQPVFYFPSFYARGKREAHSLALGRKRRASHIIS